MNLRILRIRLTILYSTIAFVACVIMVVTGVHIGTQRERRNLERQLEDHVLDTLQPSFVGQPRPEADDTWIVHINQANPDVRSIEPLKATSVEPPLYTFAQSALSSVVEFDHFVQQGDSYLSYARKLDDSTVLVAVTLDQPANDAISSLRLRLGLLALGVITAAAMAGWWIAGRSLRPAIQAKATQQDFLADAAHEMRTPLAVIQASASQALSRPRTPEEYVRSLSEIRSASERAASGVTDLLDLARFDNGQAIPRLAPLRLDLLAEEITTVVRVDGCEIVCEVGPSVVVDADLALLRQAVENVVRNAARRAPHVTITTTVDGRDGVITVTDDGRGFDEAALPYVFERFRRGDERGSAGLGLAIVKSVVLAHGGEVQAGNQPDGGAFIRLAVPLARPRPPAEKA